jgi:hypothetical protein
MKARASLARRAYPSRVLTPLEAFNFLADEDNVRVVDVRTQVRPAKECKTRQGKDKPHARTAKTN